jgi:cell division protein FtsB
MEGAENSPSAKRGFHIGRWLVLALVGFGVYAWTWGPYGIVHQRNVDHRIAAMRHENDSLRTLTRTLAQRLARLEGDSTEIMLSARRAGLVRPGEVLVRFVDTSKP